MRRVRCEWAGDDPLYVRYHDEEWGVPEHRERRLFEMLILEGAQAGLNWLTILRKRENFRAAFAGFDPERVARFGAKEVERCLADAGIVRHRGKIEAAVNNARQACELAEEAGSLAAYFWRFEPGPRDRPRRVTKTALLGMVETPASRALSKDLRRRGFRFVGPTTAYAFMQAMGLVNDHLEGCGSRAVAERERRAFSRPA